MKLRLRCTGAPVAGFGDRLRTAERLIRLGARATVVIEVLDAQGAIRPLIHRLYVALRGPERPRGPLPNDIGELLARSGARLHASFFIEHWSRLRAAGFHPALALAGAWESLAAAYEETTKLPRSLSFDHAWVLARAFESGAVIRTACTHCGRSYFDVTAAHADRCAAAASRAPRDTPRAAAALRCPHCQALAIEGSGSKAVTPTIEAQKAAARATAVQATLCALRFADPHPLSELAQRFVWAEALFRAGARPPVVTHVTGLAMTDTLRQLFVEVVGHGPRQGALPQLGEHVISTYSRKLQSSVIAVTADRLHRAGCSPAEILLATWDAYRSLFGLLSKFDINAVALILRARQHPDFALVACRRCRTSYLELRLDVPGTRCPVCRALRLAAREAA